MDCLAGIDLGSTNLKVVVFGTDGTAVASASRRMELLHPDPAHPAWAIWDPDRVWSGVGRLLQECTARLETGHRVRAVAVTGLGMDGVPVAEDGTVLYPFVSWHCPRTTPQYEAWLEKVGAEKQFSISGNPIWPFNTLFRLQWLEENQPGILERAHRFLLIEDFVNFELCGEFATDYTMASSTLLLDQRRQAWSEELIEIAGIDARLLCDPRPSGSVLGEVHAVAARATGLPEGTPVVLGGHDFLCGALATGAFRPGVISDVIGTWEIVVAGLPAPVLTPRVQKMGVWIDSHVARGLWSAMASTVAAEALEWFRREYAREEMREAAASGRVDWEILIEQAEASPPGARGVMFLPHLSGSFSPVVDPCSMGAFVGLRGQTSKGDMFRAVIEGLDYQFVSMLESFEAALDFVPEKVVAIGGGVRNRLWMQNKADVLGKPVETPELDEAVPLGAAILAGIGVGLYRDESDAFERTYRPGPTYEPNPGVEELYREGRTIFAQLHPALRDVHRRIHGASRIWDQVRTQEETS